MATALNCMYDDQSYYKRALAHLSFASAKRIKVPAVQEQVMDYLTDKSQKEWRRGWLSSHESAKLPIFGAHAPIIKDDKQLLVLDPCCNRISLDERLAVSVPMLDVLLTDERRRYSWKEVWRTLTEK